MTGTWEDKARAASCRDIGRWPRSHGHQATLSLPAGARGSKTQRSDRKRSSHQTKAKGKDEGLPRSQKEGRASLLLFPDRSRVLGKRDSVGLSRTNHTVITFDDSTS